MKASVLALLIAAGAFGASTVYLTVQLEEERAQADAIAEQTRALNARIAELESARAELEALRIAGGALSGDATGDAMSSGSAGGKVESTAVNDPARPVDAAQPADAPPGRFGGGPPQRTEAMQRMMRTQMRANFKRVHSDIGEKLGLGKEDANKLIDLMIDQQLAGIEARRSSRGLPQDERGAEFTEQQRKNLAEVSALIGADKIEAYKAYQETMPARQEVDSLSRQLEANDMSLSKDQRDRMVTALAEERRRVPAPRFTDTASREEYSAAMSAWQDDYNQRAATRASSILNGDQQQTFAEYQQWNREMRQQFEARRAARENNPERR